MTSAQRTRSSQTQQLITPHIKKPLKIKQNWTWRLNYWHSWRETRTRKTCSISNNNTIDIIIWLRRHSHLLDAVSGGVRSWIGWGIRCACAVWETGDRQESGCTLLAFRGDVKHCGRATHASSCVSIHDLLQNARRGYVSVFPGSLYHALGNVSPEYLHSLQTAGSSICEPGDTKDPQEDEWLSSLTFTCRVIMKPRQVFA